MLITYVCVCVIVFPFCFFFMEVELVCSTVLVSGTGVIAALPWKYVHVSQSHPSHSILAHDHSLVRASHWTDVIPKDHGRAAAMQYFPG